ncbi:hypothetical protein GYMLUDRAFT_46943 [Collybiopsis luxurians FD-317 M1]|uniref:Histone deacetylase 8 n=1 Tax=Collybiopsis luxurians FD-317 M1 TaxID=944289 RepID=A0A0D0C2T2_9AGAR|nr:hypothetical protein GYMLUDRAFT_46943 [Collybiopsis luxurians FD-317 M1]
MSSATLEQVVYIVSQDLVKYSSRLPSNPGRSLLVHSLVKAFGLLSPEYPSSRRLQVVKPKPATDDELGVYHARSYLDVILQTRTSSDLLESTELTEFGLEDDCPRFESLSEYVRLVAGATLTAANALKLNYADIAINWDGGRHHAQKYRASGFCYVADCVLAILLLRKAQPLPPLVSLNDSNIDSITAQKQRRPRVMYLDLDVHFSDGVSEAFYTPVSNVISPQVLTFSIHHAAPGFFPSSPLAQLPSVDSSPISTFDPFTLSIPLLLGASNHTYFTIWSIVERIKDIFKPDYIVIQCGVDGLAGDPKCKAFNWGLDVEEKGSLGWCISRIVDNWKGRKLFLGGGGYNSPNAARAWSYLTSIILGKPIPISTHIPDDPSHSGFPLYAPSFILDVPTGNMPDTNSAEYLEKVKRRFDVVSQVLQERVGVL